MISFKSSYGYNFALSVFMHQNVRFYNVGVWNSVWNSVTIFTNINFITPVPFTLGLYIHEQRTEKDVVQMKQISALQLATGTFDIYQGALRIILFST